MARRPSLVETHPHIAAEAYGWDPSTVTRGSKAVKTWWCPNGNGHPWDGMISDKVAGKISCWHCRPKNKILLKGFNDIVTLRPDLAAEAYGWNPSETVISRVPREWKCPTEGHIYTAPATVRAHGRGYGCPYCSNHRVLKGWNDFETLCPDIAEEAYGWDPSEVLSGSHTHYDWKCSAGHIWRAAPKERKSGRGCPYCSGNRVCEGFNDLATRCPEIAAEACGWDPTTVTYGSKKKMAWKCWLGHEWIAAVCSRTKNKTGCPVCNSKRILVGFNDLATKYPSVASQADGWDPTEVFPGSVEKLPWVCSLGHRWVATPLSRTHGAYGRANGTNCPDCSKPGFKPNSPAHFYVLATEMDGRTVYQFGISNIIKRRLSEHAGSGFIYKPLKLRKFSFGRNARKLEVEMLKLLELYSVPNATERGVVFEGSTESFFREDAPEEFIQEFCKLARINDIDKKRTLRVTAR